MTVMMMEMLADEQKQMNVNDSISGMVQNIFSDFRLLDGRRRFMFLEWLFNHSSAMRRTNEIQVGLTVWFESMPTGNVHREYHLILDEIGWWRALDDRSLGRMMLDHFVRSKS